MKITKQSGVANYPRSRCVTPSNCNVVIILKTVSMVTKILQLNVKQTHQLLYCHREERKRAINIFQSGCYMEPDVSHLMIYTRNEEKPSNIRYILLSTISILCNNRRQQLVQFVHAHVENTYIAESFHQKRRFESIKLV